MNWSKEQKQAIEKRGANILVSASAGSGKTTVLVERIINKVVNQKIDIDKLLVVTFTNAAASEMRQRLLDAIYKKIDENPSDEYLQKQILLLNGAHISTIHSFCLDVIRNNFFEIGMPANFRVADTAEIEIMKQEVIEDIFEKKYEEENQEFLKLLELYTTYKDDSPLKQIILEFHDFIKCVPFPEKWLNEKVEAFNIQVEDFAKTTWGKLLFEKAKELLDDCLINLKTAKEKLEINQELLPFLTVVMQDIDDIEKIKTDTWDDLYNGISTKVFETWPRKSKMDEDAKELKERAKDNRDEAKRIFDKELKSIITCNSKDGLEDINAMYPVLKSIENMVFEFSEEFTKRKREKNIVDFSDIEHLALKLLVNEDGSKTEIAEKYNFDEVAIDEYQDSNLVQEMILNSVSNGKNIFMVGDVKQSIYRFRQARPDLFLKKYEQYQKVAQDTDVDKTKLSSQETENGIYKVDIDDSDKKDKNKQNDENIINQNTKIQLYNNFRSRKNVLDLTNQIFESIMSKKLGEMDYTDEEYLNFSGSFENPKIDCIAELNIIETEGNIEDDNAPNDDEQEVLEKSVLEARYVAKRIHELIKQGFKYRDIAILLRSTAQVAPIYEKELVEQGIPVYSDTASEFLESIEINTVLSLLKIIDNPLQDIPLVTVLKSPIGGFSENELVDIRLQEKNVPFYKALVKMETKKVQKFLNILENLKKAEKELPLDELIWKIYSETGYYHYVRLMPNGKLRQANLKKLFEKAKDYEQISFKGLFNFISFIEKVATQSNIQDAKIIGENDDVVRIMSIHKSKGLEFPIVFLCGVDKKINLQDMKEKIVFDQDLGLGVNLIGQGAEYPTLSKEAIKLKMRNEAISEDMRVLYVATTRAKEKIIIVAADKNIEESLQKKKQELDKYNNHASKKINPKLIGKYIRFLDWIELVYLNNPELELKFEIVDKSDLNYDETFEKFDNKVNLDSKKIDKEKYDKINNLLNWEYKYNSSVEVPSKTSVTALKEDFLKNDYKENIAKSEEKGELTKTEDKQDVAEKTWANESAIADFKNQIEFPDFAQEKDSEIKGAKLGTLVHLTLQNIDASYSSFDDLIQKLNITQEEREALIKNKSMIENYIKSDLFESIKLAKEVYRETPFYMNIPYKETDEKVLVQGIIDIYFIDKDNHVIIVDYKTDRNVTENDLINRYKFQLDLYKEAVEKALNKKVDRTVIYSTYLNKAIVIQ